MLGATKALDAKTLPVTLRDVWPVTPVSVNVLLVVIFPVYILTVVFPPPARNPFAIESFITTDNQKKTAPVSTGHLEVRITIRRMTELLNDLFHDAQRDINDGLTAYMYSQYSNNLGINFSEIEMIVNRLLTKPTELSPETWNDFLKTLHIGIETGINITWYMPYFWDEDIHTADEIMDRVIPIVSAVFMTVSRRLGETMLRESEHFFLG